MRSTLLQVWHDPVGPRAGSVGLSADGFFGFGRKAARREEPRSNWPIRTTAIAAERTNGVGRSWVRRSRRMKTAPGTGWDGTCWS